MTKDEIKNLIKQLSEWQAEEYAKWKDSNPHLFQESQAFMEWAKDK